MKNINDEKKTPSVAIVVTAIIAAIILIGIFQIFWYEPLKAKYNESKTLLVEKEAVISDLRTLLDKKKAEFRQFKSDTALQVAVDQKEIKALKHSRSEFITNAEILIKLEKECANLCSKFVPGVLRGLKKFEALISQLTKAEAGKWKQQ